MSRSPQARPRRTPVGASNVSILNGTYHLLDMGREQYGDCVLCTFGDTTVLIDAGHPSDFKGQDGYDSIPDQLEAILGSAPPL